ncbi:MAG: anion permease, partial [Anaerolineaceae bacterium]|nr:anion permease [Anaerolineaceae bacterium]
MIVASVITLLMLRMLFSGELTKAPTNPDVVEKLGAGEAVKDGRTARRVLIMLSIAVVLFVFQERLHISTGFIALAAAAISLVWIRPDLHAVLERVDWSVFFFFTGLFVLIGGLEQAGAFDPITTVLAGLGHDNPML